MTTTDQARHVSAAIAHDHAQEAWEQADTGGHPPLDGGCANQRAIRLTDEAWQESQRLGRDTSDTTDHARHGRAQETADAHERHATWHRRQADVSRETLTPTATVMTWLNDLHDADLSDVLDLITAAKIAGRHAAILPGQRDEEKDVPQALVIWEGTPDLITANLAFCEAWREAV